MPSIQGSPPFSLSAHDWAKIGIGAVLSIVGALATYIGVEVLPQLKEHVANDVGLLIYTLLAALAPVILNIIRKALGDTTTVVKLLLIGAVLTLGLPGVASAAEAASAGPLDLLQNKYVIAIVAYVVITLLAGGKLDFNKILEMIQRVIQPAQAAEKARERKRLLDRERVADEIEQFIAEGDTEGEALARKRLDRLIKRGK